MTSYFIISLFSLSLSLAAQSQRFNYTDREINYDPNRERVRIIAAPDDFLHVWKYGVSGVFMSVYTKDLEYLTTKNLSSPGKNINFVHYANFYYAFLSDSTTTQIYQIEKEGKYTEKTKIFESQQLLVKGPHYYTFRQGRRTTFLVQQANDPNLQKTLLHLTALDSNLAFINKITLEVEYIRARPQNLLLYAIDDQLLLLNNTISNRAEVLAVSKVDVVNASFFTKLFHSEGLQFVDHQVLLSGDDIILKSQVREIPLKEEKPNLFTYVIRMNKELLVLNDIYLNSSLHTQLQHSSYFYKPVVTVPLQNKQLLSIDLGMKEQKKGSDEMLRYILLDSNLAIVKVLNQPANNGQHVPSFMFIKDKGVHFFYEELIKRNKRLVNSYEFHDGLVNDEPLLLTPSYKYDLRRSVPVSASAFVMPYTRNFRLGLVKINMTNN